MSLIVHATFNAPTGTDLINYSGELGGPFIKHASFTDALSIQSGRASKTFNTGTSVYYASAIPHVRDYAIEGVIVDIGNVNRSYGIAGWIDTASDTMIVARRQTATAWQFLKIIGTAATSLETAVTAFSALATLRHRVVRRGDLFWWWLGDTLSPLSPHTISDPEFQSPGRIGLRASNNHDATGYHVEYLTADSQITVRRNALKPAPFAPGITR